MLLDFGAPPAKSGGKAIEIQCVLFEVTVAAMVKDSLTKASWLPWISHFRTSAVKSARSADTATF